jgi:DNA-binding PadR family transcriptional regulator
MLKFALLALLDAEPMSGYELAKLAGSNVGFCWPAGHSQIYGELKKLNDAELIVGEEIPQSGKPNKVVYTVTDAGHTDLSEWATTPIPMTGHRDPTALRVFALGQTDPATAHAVLTTHLGEHEERLALYQAVADLEYGSELWPDEWGEHIGPSLALAGGIRFEESWIGWMRDIIALCERSAEVHTT